MNILPNPGGVGARVEGIDLAQPLDDAGFRTLEQALGRHGVLCYPRQTLTSRQLRDFAARFGELEVNVAGVNQDPDLPEVMILSNKVDAGGKPLGLGDAGQDWHTDMSYSRMIAFANVLYGIEIPRRDGVPLGNTEFADMHAAYEGLPADLKQTLEGKTITHDFAKFWDKMRARPGSKRGPLTEKQRAAKPPVSHPAILVHPITGRKVLYANPGYSMRINELPAEESDRILEFLFEHELKAEYRYVHRWTEGDVLMWDNIGTMHNAIPDYRPDEARFIKRCQVMATRYYEGEPA